MGSLCSQVSNGIKGSNATDYAGLKLDCTGVPDIPFPFFTQTAEEPENLSSEATAYLAKIKQTFQELADVHMMKEALRSIYSVAQNVSQAEDALLRWVKAAQEIQSDQLHKMAKTILQYWDGILGFWRFGNMTNASMEGFNNKVRTMLRQAYGYRDLEYMRLKIFNLPNNNLKIII